ncbi:Gag-Pol protein [Plakobranchus ocellatus]|uniref:Gag-Pol protein n=1 Tax=Plakobranchus ocellatus TaxID=259542 RepID=A0AAV3ZX44_9GAST|nr:Gag-Pol protein [Plakobranchus ocellatus]
MSQIVVVPKKSGGVRLCVDMREANKAIKRERQPMPTIEDMINDLDGSTVFSHIDLQQTFHQLELDGESRFITTFSTHVGLRRFKRLMFGVNAAPEIFQHALEPLRKLTRKSQPWRWRKAERDAFKKLKEALTRVGVVAYFDPKKETDILIDASLCGLGAMITQEGRVICYASRALTDVESSYSQTEREMVAVVYGFEKFHVYLYGSTFTVTTDHKPLLGMIGSSKPCSARRDRWRLRIMPYEFKLTYRSGRDEANLADYLISPSIHTTKEGQRELHPLRYQYSNSQCSYTEGSQGRHQPRRSATGCHDGYNCWEMAANLLSTFKTLKDELSAHDGVILRQIRIVIPEVLQKQVVKLAHASHQGVVRTKQLIREKVWFPGIDKGLSTLSSICQHSQAT